MVPSLRWSLNKFYILVFFFYACLGGSISLPGCRGVLLCRGAGCAIALAPALQFRLRSCQTRPQAAWCGVDWGHGALPGTTSVPQHGASLVYD